MQRRITILTVIILLLTPLVCLAAKPVNSTRPVKAASINSILNGKRITVDPGHGGSDPGAVGKSGLMEKAVTLAISSELQKLLTSAGAKVVMTRSGDYDVHSAGASDVEELQARVNVARKAKADMFISIHVDSFSDPSAGGTSTYYYPKSPQDQLLAAEVQKGLVGQLGLYNRGWRENDFYVLKYTNVPSILVEAAFISNPTEEAKLRQADFVKKAAQGIYSGIVRYYSVTTK